MRSLTHARGAAISALGLAMTMTLVTPLSAFAEDTLLSQGQEATATSAAPETSAANAFDGNMDTQWSPASSDQERYLTVDLGVRAMISKIVVDWGTSPTSYVIR